MALLESVILLDVMKVIASDDNCSCHFSREDNTPNQNRRSNMSIKLLLINRIEDSESNQPFRAKRHASAELILITKLT